MRKRTWIVLLLSGLLLGAGCVTRTERVPYHPYAPREDEGILEELRHELGWQTPQNAEPFYKRAARGVRETVSDWFHKDETPASAKELEDPRHQVEREQQEAFRRLRERQAQEQGLRNAD